MEMAKHKSFRAEKSSPLLPSEVADKIYDLKQAVQQARQSALRAGSLGAADAPLLDALIEQMQQDGNGGLNLKQFIAPPVLRTVLKDTLGAIARSALEVGDRYAADLLMDIDKGRLDRLYLLSYLSVLNVIRLRYGKEPAFANVKDYIFQKYGQDITDPEAAMGFLPERSPQTEYMWKTVDTLVHHNKLLVRETVKIKDFDGEMRGISIFLMSEVG